MKPSAGGDDPRMSNQQREREAKLAQRFWMAVYPLGTAKLWGFLLSGNDGARESQFRADCKHLEQPVRDAAKIGAAGGALALLSLRGARALSLRNLVRRRDLLYGAGQIHAAPHQQQRYKALDELVRQRKRFLSLTNVFGWVLDVSAALAASAVTAGVSVDTVSLMASFMTVPLDPEGSALASAFCPGALGALQALREESPENARIIDGQQHQPPRSLPLSYMLGFCANCQQWEILERLRSQEKLRRIREMVKLQKEDVALQKEAIATVKAQLLESERKLEALGDSDSWGAKVASATIGRRLQKEIKEHRDRVEALEEQVAGIEAGLLEIEEDLVESSEDAKDEEDSVP